MLNEKLIRCRVCGLRQDELPWGDDGQSPIYDFCPCCGVEFGYGDATPLARQRWRQQWISLGSPWAEPQRKPVGWDLDEQLRHILPPQGEIGDDEK